MDSTPTAYPHPLPDEDDDQDRVQAWQTQLPPPSSTTHKKGPVSSVSQYNSSLERADSAAARLDSLARLNGVKTPTSNEGLPSEDQEDDDDIPDFIRAAHLQDINNKKATAKISAAQSLRLPNPTPQLAYPLTNPINLGFGVGPNGRGVPRLSALQRKALEKMDLKNDGSVTRPPLGGTLLSRSHTTTGAERTPRLDISALRGQNRDQPSQNTSTEREQARSNLIRKLSNRGGLRQKAPHGDGPTLAVPVVPTKSRPRSGSLNDVKRPVSIPDWTLAPPALNREAEDVKLPVRVDDLVDQTFGPVSSTQINPLASAPSHDSNSDSAPREGISVEATPQSNDTEELCLDENLSDRQPINRNNSTHSSTRTATTTNRASSSGVSNFTLNSEFRSYRHSIERDRDSVLDRMGLLDNTLDNELEAEIATEEPTGTVSEDVSDHSSSRETDDTELVGRRPVESLPPFNRMLDYRQCSGGSGLRSPESPVMGRGLKPPAGLLGRSLTSPVQASRIGRNDLIVHQTTTTTISEGNFGQEVDPLMSPTNTSYMAIDLLSPHSSSLLDDVVLSPAPPLPEKAVRNGNHDGCLTDYKFPPSPVKKNTPVVGHKTAMERRREFFGEDMNEQGMTIESPPPLIVAAVASPWPDEYCGSPPSTAPLNVGPKQCMSDSSYQDQVNRALEQMSRGSTASSLSAGFSNPEEPAANMQSKRRLSPAQFNHSNDKNRPQRPSNPPPIGQPHRTLSRSPPAVKSQSHGHGPSQFPPAANMRTSHLPPASATDLARYNDHKLAPFPALLSSPLASSAQPTGPGPHSSPISLSNSASSSVNLTNATTVFTSPSSMSTGVSDLSVKSPRSSHVSKPSRSHGNSILSTATSFFSSNANRGRAGSASSSISVNQIGSPKLIDSTNNSFGHCPSVGSVGRIMSPSLSLSGATTYESEDHLEEIDQRSSGTHFNRDSSPILRRNTHSVVSGHGGLVSRSSSTNQHYTGNGGLSSLAPNNSIMSRSSTSRSSVSSSSATSEHRQRILQKLGPFLNLSDLTKPNLSKRPSLLNQPPRKLRLHGPVLQVVNSTSVKDRYLFLFNDILVISKPIIEFEEELSQDGERVPKLPVTLKHNFLTKSVVELSKLECVTPRLDTSAINGHVSLSDPMKNMTNTGNEDPLKMAVDSKALLSQFVTRFAQDPFLTVTDSVQRGLIKEDHAYIAKVLFLTTELDKKQLGTFLCSTANTKILKAFIDRFKFHHCRIDDALRVLLLSIRLPNDTEAVERLLSTFASQWVIVNEQIGITQSLAFRIIKALLGLNDALHSSLYDSTKYVTRAFALPVGMADCVENFVEGLKAFRDHESNRSFLDTSSVGGSGEGDRRSGKFSHEEEKLISEEKLVILLTKVYSAIQRDKIVQAKSNEDETDRILISNSVASLDPEGGGLLDAFPNRLTYQISSGIITFTLPEVDSHFAIKLFSTGLKFDPPFLTFSKSRSCSFKILGRSLGLCNITFIKIGSHASRYVGLPLSKTVLVERAFMRETLQISFKNHLQATRKYLFSFDTPEQRIEFVEFVGHAQSQQLQQQQKMSSNGGSGGGVTGSIVAQAAAMQVLRDTLIPNEEFLPLTANPHTQTTITLSRTKPNASKSTSSNNKNSSNASASQGNPATSTHRIRSNSLSDTYIFGIGSAEKALQNAIVSKRAIAQELQIKKNQQKLLAISLRQNIEGGRAGLNPYSISKAEEMMKQKNKNKNEFNNHNGENNHNHSHGNNNYYSNNKDVLNVKDELEVFLEKFWRCGEELITQCEQNSLIPLVLGFLSNGVVN